MTAWTSPKTWGTATVTVADMNTYNRDNTLYLYENLVDNEGWIAADEAWTYLSATSLTISGDYTARYTRGTKITCYQSGRMKYFYVLYSTGLADVTTVYLAGAEEDGLIDAAIESRKYSREATPYQFPNTFDYTPSITGLSTATQKSCKWSLHGNECSVYVYIEGTSNAGSLLFSVPISSGTSPTLGTVSTYDMFNQYNPALVKNNGTVSVGIMNSLTTNRGSIQVRLGDTAVSFATAGAKGVYGQLTYLIDDNWIG